MISVVTKITTFSSKEYFSSQNNSTKFSKLIIMVKFERHNFKYSSDSLDSLQIHRINFSVRRWRLLLYAVFVCAGVPRNHSVFFYDLEFYCNVLGQLYYPG
jgi:hypothetical protein